MKKAMKILAVIVALAVTVVFVGDMFAGNKSPLFSRKQSGGVFTFTDEAQTTGNIWFVYSGATYGGDAAGYGENPDFPFKTIDYAIGQATASQGDWIVVMPGHTETLSAVSAIAVDQAGLRFIGLGTGDNRPTISWAATTATIGINAKNISFENFKFRMGDVLSGVSVLRGIDVMAGAENVSILNSDFIMSSASGATRVAIGIDLTGGTKFTVNNCRVYGSQNVSGIGATGVTAFICVGPAVNNVAIKNTYMDFATGSTPYALVRAMSGASGFVISDSTLCQANSGASTYNVADSVDGLITRTAILDQAPAAGLSGVTWIDAKRASLDKI